MCETPILGYHFNNIVFCLYHPTTTKQAVATEIVTYHPHLLRCRVCDMFYDVDYMRMTLYY